LKDEFAMKFIKKALNIALGVALVSPLMSQAGNEVVIGDIDDMSGVYADVIGQGGVELVKMAIEDFGGTVLG
jgi:branched-chain amino acid transport system substrate-binding protein